MPRSDIRLGPCLTRDRVTPHNRPRHVVPDGLRVGGAFVTSLSLVAVVIAVFIGTPAAVAQTSARNYRCVQLITAGTLKSVTGRKYAPSPTNSKQHGDSITCVFIPLPRYPLPPAMRHDELALTVSARPADIARVRKTYRGRLHSLNGLGSSAIETVSTTGMQQIIALGPGFVLSLRVYGPMGFPREEQIGRKTYAAAAR